MSINEDFYGDQTKWFVGVVKNINDPNNSNYVQVRIKGIHPEAGDDDMVTPGSGSSGGSSGGSSNASGGASGASPAPISVDASTLPNAAQLNQKISKHFTLAQLTIGAEGSGSKRSSIMGIKSGKLTKEIITNLANLARNCLDPIADHYGHVTITSGWRIGVSAADNGASGGNHPKGIAADIKVPGAGPTALANWIQQNLRGRYNFLMTYNNTNHVHIQLGGSSRQGTTSNPVIIRPK